MKSQAICAARSGFTYASELTYTLKMKRRVIEERYQDVIARLYADVEEPGPAPGLAAGEGFAYNLSGPRAALRAGWNRACAVRALYNEIRDRDG